MVSTTLKHRVNQALSRSEYLIPLFKSFFHLIKRKFVFTIADLDIHRLGLLKFCFLLYLRVQRLKIFIVKCANLLNKRVPFLISNKSSIPFYLIHIDICPTIPNVSEARQFVSFMDDCTHVTWIFLLKYKFDVNTVLPNFCSMIKNQFGVNIKRFKSDNARDYFNQILTPYFQKGIVHESSYVNTPQQNRVAGRKNDHLLEST